MEYDRRGGGEGAMETESGDYEDLQNIIAIRTEDELAKQRKMDILKWETNEALKLRNKLNNIENPLQLLLEFDRYKELVKRSKVSFDLRSNREILARELIKIVDGNIERVNSDEFLVGNGVPNLLTRNFYYVSQLRDKVQKIEKLSDIILTDLPDYSRLKASIAEAIRVMKEYESDAFDSWLNLVEKEGILEELNLQISGPVVKFNETTRLMEVNLNSKFQFLVEDVAQLAMLGFEVPNHVASTVNLARGFLKLAQQLDKTANYHNTVGNKMIPCLRPMILELAVKLSQLVQIENSVTWNNLEQVRNYTAKLDVVVGSIGTKYNQLEVMHAQIKAIVLKLFTTDLFPDPKQWNDSVLRIRDIFDRAANMGFKNMRTWKIHWEHQIYKAMEVQYAEGLRDIHNKLPRIPLEIVYRERRLQFKPSLEEARAKYYANVRRLISIPERFQGVLYDPNDDPPTENIFMNIIHTSLSQSGYYEIFWDRLAIVNLAKNKIRQELPKISKKSN